MHMYVHVCIYVCMYMYVYTLYVCLLTMIDLNRPSLGSTSPPLLCVKTNAGTFPLFHFYGHEWGGLGPRIQ